MGWFDSKPNQAEAYNEVVNSPNKAKLSHELLASAAAYEASKGYENHCKENGKPPTHAKAKELIATFTGGFIDREVETKGLNFIDRAKAKHHAKQEAEQGLASSGDYS